MSDPVAAPPQLTSIDENGKSVPASKAEVQQALADISCKKKTDWVTTANSVHVEYSLRAIDENQLALQASKDFYDNALKKANEVIANG